MYERKRSVSMYKEEIIRMIKEIDNIEILEEIYHFVKNLLKAEKLDG